MPYVKFNIKHEIKGIKGLLGKYSLVRCTYGINERRAASEGFSVYVPLDSYFYIEGFSENKHIKVYDSDKNLVEDFKIQEASE